MEKLQEKHAKAVFDEQEGYVIDDTGLNSANITKEMCINFLKFAADSYIDHCPPEQCFDRYLETI